MEFGTAPRRRRILEIIAMETSSGAEDLAELEIAFRKSPTDVRIQQKILSVLRTNRIRRPDLVMRCGPYLLNKARGRLGNTVWDVREQVLIAALDLSRLDVAEMELPKLQKNFAGSLRVKGLEGMLNEARAGTATAIQNGDRYRKEALRCYDEMLKEDPCNAFARKRKVCIFRAIGTPEALNYAVKAMNEYLELYPVDVDAWQELATMFLDLQQVEQAKYAFEEVVLLSPVNYMSHLKLAEALYTLADYSTARKYYAQSLELNPDSNARAAFGLVLCTTALQNSRNMKAEDKTLNTPLFECGRQLLLEHYSEVKPSETSYPVQNLVKSWLGV